MLKVTYFLADIQGCGFFRCGIPAKYLNLSGHTASLTPGYNALILDYPDLLVFQRQYHRELYDKLLNQRSLKKKFVYDLDDNIFDIPSWNPAKHLIKEEWLQTAKDYLNFCDAITVSTPYLKKEISQYTKRPITVLPNALDLDFFNEPYLPNITIADSNFLPQIISQEQLLKEKDQGIVSIGWAGGFSHFNDLKIIIGPMIQICKEFPNVRFYIMAFCLKDIWRKISWKQLRLVPAENILSYFQVFKSLRIDIGLAPLAQIRFNLSKSNLKVLEYFAQGVVPLATKMGPYTETILSVDPDLLVEREEDWYEKIKTLILNPTKRAQISQLGKAFVYKHFDMKKNISSWIAFYEKVLETSL